jgi:muramidase (phage lysozyme)
MITETQNIKKFLDLLAFSEGTSVSKFTKNNGYDIIVDGVNSIGEIFSDYSHHPFQNRVPKLVLEREEFKDGKPIGMHRVLSSAAGRYQILWPTYKHLSIVLNLHDFTPYTQDCMAVELIRQRFPLDQLGDETISNAIHACSVIWASLPGNNYGQGGHTLEALINKWHDLSLGGTVGQLERA